MRGNNYNKEKVIQSNTLNLKSIKNDEYPKIRINGCEKNSVSKTQNYNQSIAKKLQKTLQRNYNDQLGETFIKRIVNIEDSFFSDEININKSRLEKDYCLIDNVRKLTRNAKLGKTDIFKSNSSQEEKSFKVDQENLKKNKKKIANFIFNDNRPSNNFICDQDFFSNEKTNKSTLFKNLFKVYSKKVSDFLIKNADTVTLFGDEKYFNKKAENYILEKLEKSSDKFDEKIITTTNTSINSPQYQKKIKRKIELCPVPAKIKFNKEKIDPKEFYENERTAVSLRRIEYNMQINRITEKKRISQHKNKLIQIILIQYCWRKYFYSNILPKIIYIQRKFRIFFIKSVELSKKLVEKYLENFNDYMKNYLIRHQVWYKKLVFKMIFEIYMKKLKIIMKTNTKPIFFTKNIKVGNLKQKINSFNTIYWTKEVRFQSVNKKPNMITNWISKSVIFKFNKKIKCIENFLEKHIISKQLNHQIPLKIIQFPYSKEFIMLKKLAPFLSNKKHILKVDLKVQFIQKFWKKLIQTCSKIPYKPHTNPFFVSKQKLCQLFKAKVLDIQNSFKIYKSKKNNKNSECLISQKLIGNIKENNISLKVEFFQGFSYLSAQNPLNKIPLNVPIFTKFVKIFYRILPLDTEFKLVTKFVKKLNYQNIKYKNEAFKITKHIYLSKYSQFKKADSLLLRMKVLNERHFFKQLLEFSKRIAYFGKIMNRLKMLCYIEKWKQILVTNRKHDEDSVKTRTCFTQSSTGLKFVRYSKFKKEFNQKISNFTQHIKKSISLKVSPLIHRLCFLLLKRKKEHLDCIFKSSIIRKNMRDFFEFFMNYVDFTRKIHTFQRLKSIYFKNRLIQFIRYKIIFELQKIATVSRKLLKLNNFIVKICKLLKNFVNRKSFMRILKSSLNFPQKNEVFDYITKGIKFGYFKIFDEGEKFILKNIKLHENENREEIFSYYDNFLKNIKKFKDLETESTVTLEFSNQSLVINKNFYGFINDDYSVKKRNEKASKIDETKIRKNLISAPKKILKSNNFDDHIMLRDESNIEDF